MANIRIAEIAYSLENMVSMNINRGQKMQKFYDTTLQLLEYDYGHLLPFISQPKVEKMLDINFAYVWGQVVKDAIKNLDIDCSPHILHDMEYCVFPARSYAGQRGIRAVMKMCRLVLTNFVVNQEGVIGAYKTRNGTTIATSNGYAMVSDNSRHATIFISSKVDSGYIPTGRIITPIDYNVSLLPWLCLMFMCIASGC